MTSELLNPLDKLKTALAEVREQRAVFTEESYSTMVMALLDRIRRLQITANTTGAMTDEIRLVTVLFVDVKDSTRLAQTMDTGDFKTVLEEAHRRISVLVLDWDGTIGQYLGDGVLAFFGAQKSRGDDALRCVACALAIQTSIEAYANEVFLDYGMEFSVRIGISTGRLVVGMTGSADHQELLAVGPATNLAARLQAQAPAGGIYTDSATYSRIRSHFNVLTRPMIHMKGFEEPVLVFEVQGRSVSSSTQLVQTTLATLPIPLVGREDVLTEIAADILTALQTSTLHVMTLIGDIGMGKSHILQETSDKIDQDRFIRIQIVAHYELRSRTHNLLRDFLTRYCGLTDTLTAEEAQQQLVETITNTWDDENARNVAELMGYLAGYGFETNVFVRSLMLNSDPTLSNAHRWIARFLRGITQQRRMPLLLVVDNLQWADPESIALLEFLAHDLHDLPFTLLLAARPLLDTVYPQYMSSVILHRRILLDRLSATTTQRMIETILQPIERIPAHVIALIVERAQGNPLFVIEFLSMLFDSNVFQRGRDGRWRFNLVLYDSTYKNLPSGLIDVIQSRLDDLSPEVRLILQLAAVVGQTFWKDVVDELAGRDQTETLELLQMRGIILLDTDSSFEGEIQYSFRHSLYRDVAYEMLPRAKRELHHRQVSKWMIVRIATKASFFSVLAEHFEAGDEIEAALFTYLEAAQNRLQRGMLSEALKLIERALALARSIPREIAISVTVPLWTLQAQALVELDRFSEAAASAQSALRLLGEMPSTFLAAVRVTAARLLAEAYTGIGDYGQAQQAIEQAYAAADPNDPLLMTCVLRVYGILHLHRGALAEAHQYLQRALVCARKTQQEQDIIAALSRLGYVTLELGLVGESLGYFEECLEFSAHSGIKHHQINHLKAIGMVYLNLHQLLRAETTFEAAQQLRDELAMGDTMLTMYRLTGQLYLHRRGSDLDELRRLATLQHRDLYTQLQVRLGLLDALLWMQQSEAAHQMAEQLLPQVQKVNPVLYARTLLRLGQAKLMLGEADAVGILRTAAETEQQLGGREVWLAYLVLAQADPLNSTAAYAVSARHMRAMGAGLAARPDLQYAFLNSPIIAQILAMIPDEKLIE